MVRWSLRSSPLRATQSAGEHSSSVIEGTENPCFWSLSQGARESKKARDGKHSEPLLSSCFWQIEDHNHRLQSKAVLILFPGEPGMTAAGYKGRKITDRASTLRHRIFPIKKPGHVLWQRRYSNLWLLFTDKQREKISALWTVLKNPRGKGMHILRVML